jgi:hypothetical protein
MEAIIFTLIGMRKEKFVSESAEFRPFDLRALTHTSKAEGHVKLG